MSTTTHEPLDATGRVLMKGDHVEIASDYDENLTGRRAFVTALNSDQAVTIQVESATACGPGCRGCADEDGYSYSETATSLRIIARAEEAS